LFKGQHTRLGSSVLSGLLILLLAGFFAVRNVSSWPARIYYPGEQSYEGAALAEITRLAQGVPIYNPPSEAGFAGATYGPLYFITSSYLIDPAQPSYRPLRLLSALAILGCAYGCALLAFWLTRSYWALFLSPLIFFSYGIVTYHGVSALSDNVALFLFFSGFLIAYKFRHSSAILLCVPFIAAGFYYKQQFVAGPVAVFIYLLLEKRYFRAAQFAGALGATTLVLFGYFQWVVFRGQEFWRHFLFYQSTLFSWHDFRNGALVFLLIFAAPLALGLDFLRTHPDRLITCYEISAVALGLATIGKESAFIQYFYESILMISVLGAAFVAARLRERGPAFDAAALLGFAFVTGQFYIPSPPTPANLADHQAVQMFLRNRFPPGTRALGFRGGDLVQAGLDTPFADLFQTELLARRGIVSNQALVSRIRQAWFSVIVLDFDLDTEHDPFYLNFYLTEPTRQAIAQNYRLASTLKVPAPEWLREKRCFYVYVPQLSPAGLGSHQTKRGSNLRHQIAQREGQESPQKVTNLALRLSSFSAATLLRHNELKINVLRQSRSAAKWCSTCCTNGQGEPSLRHPI
jgi:hypothetical protein